MNSGDVQPSSSSSSNTQNVIFALVSNIPLDFHTPDLRNFFSYAIEKDFFMCFNYRHRPHHSKKFNTCICKVRPNRFDEFTKLYDKKNWIDQRGRINTLKCSIVKIKPSRSDNTSKASSLTATTSSEYKSNKLSEQDLNDLLEFARIPKWMPEGNVGTPTRTFVKYINNCSMPTSLIAKIGVNLKTFKKHKKRAYANVEYKYDENEYDDEDDVEDEEEKVSHVEVASTANGHRIEEEIDDEKEIREKNYSNEKKLTLLCSKEDKKDDDKEDEDNDGDELEDWERHEALHEDVTKQDRTSPYFFEHEIELKWEKGGSGLVFYTVC